MIERLKLNVKALTVSVSVITVHNERVFQGQIQTSFGNSEPMQSNYDIVGFNYICIFRIDNHYFEITAVKGSFPPRFLAGGGANLTKHEQFQKNQFDCF